MPSPASCTASAFSADDRTAHSRLPRLRPRKQHTALNHPTPRRMAAGHGGLVARRRTDAHRREGFWGGVGRRIVGQSGTEGPGALSRPRRDVTGARRSRRSGVRGTDIGARHKTPSWRAALRAALRPGGSRGVAESRCPTWPDTDSPHRAPPADSALLPLPSFGCACLIRSQRSAYRHRSLSIGHLAGMRITLLLAPWSHRERITLVHTSPWLTPGALCALQHPHSRLLAARARCPTALAAVRNHRVYRLYTTCYGTTRHLPDLSRPTEYRLPTTKVYTGYGLSGGD